MNEIRSFPYCRREIVAIVSVLCIRFAEPGISCSEGIYFRPIFAGSITGEPYTYSLCVADFNDDAIPDFIHNWNKPGRFSTTGATVWYGNGDGTLRADTTKCIANTGAMWDLLKRSYALTARHKGVMKKPYTHCWGKRTITS
ncbi:MAG TPA: hypothetical protein PK395_15860 [bacterium]|nr:hypothetical protein [bacterium]